MTANSLLSAFLPLVADLSRELPEGERYRRLLDALRELLPCDATALLRLEGEQLVPLAVHGLSADTLGRRFKVAEHPRLKALLENRLPTHFAADSDLPDPYDGLVDGVHGHLEVHDCMGCSLYLDERPWGVLTLDALDAECFSPADLSTRGHRQSWRAHQQPGPRCP
jgi:anaerobic nitric oxide reductase transcription regulator